MKSFKIDLALALLSLNLLHHSTDNKIMFFCWAACTFFWLANALIGMFFDLKETDSK